MDRELFRREAMDFQKEMLMSSVTFWQGPGWKVYAGLAALVMGVGLLFVSQWPFGPSMILMGHLDSDGTTNLKAYFYAPTPVVLELTRGQQLAVVVEGFPEETIGRVEGKVVGISQKIMLPQEIPEFLRLMEPAWRVEVDLNVGKGLGSADLGDLLDQPAGDVKARLAGRLRSGLRVSAEVRAKEENFFDKILK